MRVLGVDCSTTKMAWSIVKDGDLEAYGEIYFRETSFNGKLKVARKQLEDFVPLFGDVDYIAFEKTVYVKSVDTMIKLAEMFGTVKSCLLELDAKLVEVTPVAWQSWIGNPVIRSNTQAFKDLMEKHPELKTKAQRSTFIRNYRKNLTLDWVEKKTDVRMTNDDLSDSAGLAFYVYDNYEKIEEKLNGKG